MGKSLQKKINKQKQQTAKVIFWISSTLLHCGRHWLVCQLEALVSHASADACSTSGAARQLTSKERQQQRRSIVWLTVAVGTIAAYVLLSGQFVQLGYEFDDDDELEE